MLIFYLSVIYLSQCFTLSGAFELSAIPTLHNFWDIGTVIYPGPSFYHLPLPKLNFWNIRTIIYPGLSFYYLPIPKLQFWNIGNVIYVFVFLLSTYLNASQFLQHWNYELFQSFAFGTLELLFLIGVDLEQAKALHPDR